MKWLYDSSVRRFFSQASNRDAYREGVELLRKLINLVLLQVSGD